MRPARSSKALWSCSRSLSCGSTHAPRHPSPSCHASRSFSTTPSLEARRKPKHISISADELAKIRQAQADQFAPYTEADKKDLAKRFTPQQMAAIEAGEKAIKPADLAAQARPRGDYLKPKYLEDWSRIHPAIDKSIERIRGDGMDYAETLAKGLRWQGRITGDDDAQMDSLVEEMANPWKPATVEEQADGGETLSDLFRQTKDGTLHIPREIKQDDKLTEKLRATGHKTLEGALGDIPDDLAHDLDEVSESDRAEYQRRLEENPSRAPKGLTRDMIHERLASKIYIDEPSPHVAPATPYIRDPTVEWTNPAALDTRAKGEEEALAMVKLSQYLSTPISDLRSYRSRVLVTNRVSNQTRLGKVHSIYCLVVVGDQNGMIGMGEGKSETGREARLQAFRNALRSMAPVHRYENRTIYGEQRAKVSGVELTIAARPPGFGLRCSSHVHEIMRCVGITDLQSKITRGRNPMNVSKAVFAALTNQRHPEDIARGRGRKMVDVRKVYYAGLV